MIVLGTLGVATQRVSRDAPPDACLARLTAIDNPRFERTGRTLQFDGTLLFRPTSLYVEGTLDSGDHIYRLNRMLEWERRWFAPSWYRLAATHRYFGDGVPGDVAAQLPVFGENRIELRFVGMDAWTYAVLSNDVFITYCRRLPSIELLIPANGATEPASASGKRHTDDARP
ncbi:MAG TPA: hypothetical protein VL424_20370 [Pararobbsia sp.]|nr:hypothetical protein [Pararobbsia sp.]